MNVKIVNKPAFTVIGKLGQGPAESGAQWVPPLWAAADAAFEEIQALAKYRPDGSLVGLWGAMSDVAGTFAPWRAQGKYLAGCEAKDDAEAPRGWTKWVIPAATYAVANCTLATYTETFDYMLGTHLPQNGYTLAGAVHEFYPQPGSEKVSLYFPVKKKE